MSSVYVVEFFFPETNENVYKIGSTDLPTERRIYEIHKNKFNSHGYYNIHAIFPCDKNTRLNLENFIINSFISEIGVKPFEGREWFKDVKRDRFLGFISSIDNKIIEFFDTNKHHAILPINIGLTARSKRKLLKLSQTELGKSVKIRQATISDFENGKLGTFKTFKRICDALSLRIIIVNDDGRYI